MNLKDQLTAVAVQTIDICTRGVYTNLLGEQVFIEKEMALALKYTRVIPAARSIELDVLEGEPPVIHVTSETTSEAASRIAIEDDTEHVGVLNFASAKHPGGGFLRGSMAQEEDLCRVSGLYPCLAQQRCEEDFYGPHKAARDPMYSSTMVYSPDVPFFREDDLSPSEDTFTASVVTAAAPNAGELDEGRWHLLPDVFDDRVQRVLRLFASEGIRNLVLGAWGCGVFKNDPTMVAETFFRWLRDPRFAGHFKTVVFAIPGKGSPNHNAFALKFPTRLKYNGDPEA